MDRPLRLLASLVFCAAVIAAGCIERKPERLTKKESPVSSELTLDLREHEQMRAVGTFSRQLIREADLRHRQTVYQLLTQALIVEPEDLFRAAVLLQTDDSVVCAENSLLAYYCAIEAVRRGYGDAKYLAAQSLDKYLIGTGLPQKYGTQLTFSPAGDYQLFSYDSATSDSERAVWNVPPLDTLKARAAKMGRPRSAAATPPRKK